jgi:MYXO-CTERM domain-containing protein
MKRSLWAAALAATAALVAGPAQAHIELNNPMPRFQVATADQKPGPCGAGTATGAVTVYNEGDSIPMTWVETIDHPGHFRVALDVNNTDTFTMPSAIDDTTADGNEIAYIIDPGGETNFAYTLDLPMGTTCDQCTIQVIQVMTDSPLDPYYFWCADIKINALAVGTGGAGGMSTSGAGGAGGGDSTGASTTSGAGGGSAAASSSSGGPKGAYNGLRLTEPESHCSVAAPGFSGSRGAGWAAALLGLGFALQRRRQRRKRQAA